MEISITGGSGFIGNHLIPQLTEEGYRVRVLSRNALPNSGSLENVQGDLLAPETLDKFVEGCDVLIHLAARQLPPQEQMFEDNVTATNNLLEAAKRHNIPQVIYLSTIAVYGEGKAEPFDENDTPQPNTEYGRTKYQAEEAVKEWAKTTGKQATILRPFNVYGPGNNKGVVFNFYKSLKEKGEITINGTGEQRRDFLYVEDLIRAIILSLKKPVSGTFNLGSGINTSLLDLVEVFKKVLSEDVKVKFNPAEAGKVLDVSYKTERAKEDLGWNPSTSLEDGIRETLQSYKHF